MSKFVVFFGILMRVHVMQWSTLSSAMFFYCSNLVLINFIVDIHESAIILKMFVLFILNFTSAFIIKNSYADDHTSTRLCDLSRNPFVLIYFLLAKISVFTIYVFAIQIFFYPCILLLFKSLYQNNGLYTIFWFLLSAFYLSIHYLLAESFTLRNRSNSFMGFVIVTPLLIPWFVFSTAFVLYNQTEALGIIFGFILLLAPCLIGAQYWLIRHGIKL